MTLADRSMQMALPEPGRALPVADPAVTQPGRLPWPVAIYLLAVMIPITFRLGPLFMTSLRMVVLLMIVPLVVQLLMGRYGRLIWTDLLFFLHLVWTGLALQVNNPDLVITQIGSAGVEFLGGYLVGRACIRTRADFRALCRWLMWAVLFTLPFAFYETRTGYPPIIGFLKSLPGIDSLAIIQYPQRLGLNRVQVMTTHPIHYGLFASSIITLTFLGMKGVLSDTARWMAMLGVAVCTFLSLSSGALLPMLMQLFLALWARAFDRTGKPWLILVILVVLAYVTIDLLSNRSPIQVFFTYGTFSAHNAYYRGIIFEWGMVNVWRSPIFGIGLNDWERPWFMHSSTVDNFWLLMAMRYGLPGFGFLAVGYLLAMWRIGRRDFSGDAELLMLRRAWMFTFVGLTFTLCTVHVWTTVYSFVFMLFGAGMWFLQADPAGKATPDEGTPARGTRPGLSPASATAGPARPAPAAAAQPVAPAYTRFPAAHDRQSRTPQT